MGTVIGTRGEYVTYMAASVTGVDARGNDVTTFTSSTVGPCAFVPGSEAEATEGSEQTTTGALLYMPAGTPVSPLDRIQRFNGEVYEITGESNAWASPFTGTASPVQVRLRRVVGATAHLDTETEGSAD